jgi:molybdopterin molybdotransferase
MMISVQQASDAVLSHLYKPEAVSVPIHEAVGRILAEGIYADRDLPPFHRVTMDGIAIKFESWKRGKRKFQLEGTQAAGEPQQTLINPENAIEVMTGAMLPLGTDTVIRYEDLQIAPPYVTILTDKIEAGQSIHRQGQDAKKQEPLLPTGMVLSPAEIALLATVGKSNVTVYSYPRAALVASGDELVEVEAIPSLHQIRRSNTYAVEAAMRTLHWPAKHFHLRDEKDVLKKSIAEILEEHDVLILSGGVSQGKFDFIPAVMEELGVKKIFHQVSQRPGKPFWFGVSAKGKTVFALPGNPVSTFMCFYRYIKPWLLKSLGVEDQSTTAILAKDFSFPPKLTYFLQVTIKNEEGRLMAYPDAGGGSGDFANLKKINGFLELPAERSEFKAGEVFPWIAFRL